MLTEQSKKKQLVNPWGSAFDTMRRIHIKGDVLCTLILVVLLCILWYVHQSLKPTWGTLRIEHGSSSSRALLGAPTKGISPPSQTPYLLHCDQESTLQAQTKSKQQNKFKNQVKSKKKQGKKKTTAKTTTVPTLPQFDFEDYLLKKDQRQFKMLIDQPEKCKGPEGAPYLLIAIKSVAVDFDKRQVVRQTWGKEGVTHKRMNIMTVFLLGVPQNITALPLWDRLLAYESHMFKDILLWDFEDTFFNLTLKETHFLQWVNSSCSNVQFIFKGDSDVFVNIENVLEMLDDKAANEDLFVGDIIFHAKPIRRRNSKYYVPEFIYGQGIYPSYAGGGGFVMSGHTALRLHLACKEVELFPIDDVFLGMCLLRIGLKPSRHEGFRTFGIVRPSAAPHLQVFDPCFYRELMVVHSLNVPQIWLMWNLLHDPSVHCHTNQIHTAEPFQWIKNTPEQTKTEDSSKADYDMQVFLKD
ncbi:UDP-GlcNAc:betaGal beta-1,3-N-acetylglucosaminyltransferase 9 isoform 1-T2 [Clarias gariepinus]|uniref:UDP-GlcNAc:betaGal beta-1,3-N-acetylglucosaminyltransferase 9 n=1 Tax=Clarias gariepinus TaxID=13013 RepID=UPI00234E0FF1|nr:UDP-GlcNAc:betaGal beta-1,3-N-acetylglucosaminyltransferase 9 [Clarias gariepinus]XP_053356219.1 UDP-GlcNAc:betaGal beta-1,3-N-acetylglucosaminyltransferase 9 [Clarias gariepinus]